MTVKITLPISQEIPSQRADSGLYSPYVQVSAVRTRFFLSSCVRCASVIYAYAREGAGVTA